MSSANEKKGVLDEMVALEESGSSSEDVATADIAGTTTDVDTAAPATGDDAPAGRLTLYMDEEKVLGLHRRLASKLFRLVRKRSGQIVPFDRKKITTAIFRAAQEVGGRDREVAERLTDEVLLYLYSEKDSNLPQVEDIQDAIEKVLIERGHAKTAKAFILYRDRRSQVRQKTVNAELAEREQKRAEAVDATDLALFVRTSGDDMVVWEREKIIETLVREADVSVDLAE